MDKQNQMTVQDELMHRMNADMQVINNAAQFAKQAVYAKMTDNINTLGYVETARDYMPVYDAAYAVALAMEERTIQHIKAKAASYEAEMKAILEERDVRIEVPEKKIIL